MLISSIVATAQDNIIGKNNRIPWYLSNDLKYFKRTTLGHHVIMGRKSFESIGRPLPKRTNIIITRNIFFAASNCLVAHSVEEALELAHDNGEEVAFIIGGAQIYEQSMAFWDKLYLTEVDAQIDFSPEDEIARFPKWQPGDNWEEISCDCHSADEKNDHDYCFKVFKRMG
jgi:dihydrofolate reductase